MKNNVYKVARGGVMSALCLMCMFLAGIIPALYLALPMISGVLMMIIADEVNTSWGLLTYVTVSILSLFFTFDKEAALIFIMFFGHYPLIKPYFEKIKFFPLRIAVKFAVYNVCILSFFGLTVYIFGFTAMLDEMNEFGKYGGLSLLILANLFFPFYDLDLKICKLLYIKRLKPILKGRG